MASQLDIARAVGVSQPVVSRVLGGQGERFKISKKTVEKILQVAQELDYRPNRAADIVFGRKTNLIGVIVRSFHDPFLSIVLDEINERAVTEDMGVVVAGLSDHKDPLVAVRLLQGYRPDAMVVIGTVDFSNWTEYLSHEGQTIVQIGLPSESPQVITCSTSDSAAAEMLVEHLRDLGHRDLGFVMDESRTSEARLLELQKALRGTEMQIVEGMIALGCDISGESDPDRFDDLLQAIRTRRITAVICAGDMIAAGLSRNLVQAGIQIPRDVSLASYNDLPMAAVFNPPLTTVRLPARELAAAAMDIVLGKLPAKSVEIRPSLMIRESAVHL